MGHPRQVPRSVRAEDTRSEAKMPLAHKLLPISDRFWWPGSGTVVTSRFPPFSLGGPTRRISSPAAPSSFLLPRYNQSEASEALWVTVSRIGLQGLCWTSPKRLGTEWQERATGGRARGGWKQDKSGRSGARAQVPVSGTAVLWVFGVEGGVMSS